MMEPVEVRPPALLPPLAVAAAALVGAIALVAQAALGPLGTGHIEYRTSPSATWQIAGGDVVNALLIAPLLVFGAVLLLRGRDGAKYLLVLTPLTVFYSALAVGVGEEWSHPAYSGNSERFAWLFLVQVVAALIVLIDTLARFGPRDAPPFSRRSLRMYVVTFALFLALFALMWLGEMLEVMSTGDTASGAYAASPTAFWLVRFFDLGIVIPLGYVSLYLLYRQPERGYGLVLLIFGFLATLGTSVNAMAVAMLVNGDPSVQGGALVIFPVLAALSWGGWLYLVWEKLPHARLPGGAGRTMRGGA